MISERLRVHTRPIETDLDLIDLLPEPGNALSWVRAGEGLIGWGEVARCRTDGAGRFATARRWWEGFRARLDVVDEVGAAGTGPVAFASLAFADDPGDSVVIVPRVVIGRAGGRTWITEISSGETRSPAVPPARVPVAAPGPVVYSEGRFPARRFREAVATAISRMAEGGLDKVVLAHDLLATAKAPLDPRFLLRALADQYPTCWTFAVDGLVGATPELLLRKNGATIESRVLAGTTWCGRDRGDETAELSADKNTEEHRFAVESLAEALAPYCGRLEVPNRARPLRLPNVTHLATDIRATLTTRTDLFELTEAVHPTAAVGGTPRTRADQVINELERMDRGRYAGPVGWVDADGNGEFGLALRCASLHGPTARLYAGCGIVPGSDPDAEVAEAAAKMVPVRNALAEGSA